MAITDLLLMFQYTLERASSYFFSTRLLPFFFLGMSALTLNFLRGLINYPLREPAEYFRRALT